MEDAHLNYPPWEKLGYNLRGWALTHKTQAYTLRKKGVSGPIRDPVGVKGWRVS